MNNFRETIEKRIDNEKRLRREGYSNREIAQIMGVGYHIVIKDIGREPAELRERRKENSRRAIASIHGDGSGVKFPGSYEPSAEPYVPTDGNGDEEQADTPFALAWKKAEQTREALQNGLQPHISQSAPEVNRKPMIISDTLDNARRSWSRIVDGEGLLTRQPEIQNVSMWFDRENKPWLTIVYSEVC